MVIKIESEDTIVIVDNDDIITWTAAVEKFVEMLRGCGYMPSQFTYKDGEVIKWGYEEEEVDNDMFDVNPISDHD